MQADREGAGRPVAVPPVGASGGSWDWVEQESPSAV